MMMIFMNFQNNNSMNLYNINKLNDKIMIIMLMMFLTIMFMNNSNINNKLLNKNYFNNQIMEMIWTLIPMMLIIMISYMSIIVLFINYEFKMNFINIKILSNQWFWNYNYINLNKNFNSYLMMKKNFNFNLIETDNKLIIPINYQIMIIISSLDVIHSWTIPSMNIKIDAIPNQINNMMFMINKINLLYGQCSEICGINHSFMPIMIESIKFMNFLNWIKK